jgi:LacI family transcriptional regulator
MAINDHVAMELLQACELAQLRIPERVVVLGVDNDELVVDLTAVPLSSVDSNRERIGYEAARLLDRLIDGKPPEHKVNLIPPKGVVTRKSTDILAVNDTDVAIAIHYIWEHFREPITVDDVARQTTLSRRHLQDRFMEHVGRTLFEELTLQRLNYAKRLLEQTDEKAYTVARLAGFGSAERMSKVFRRTIGMGPRTYRERHCRA